MAEKILVVDDDEDMLLSTRLVLEDLGYDVVTASDAVDVPELATKEKPDLILQDLKMDDLNLSGLVASLRTDPATAEIPIVFFSGQSDLARKARRHGVWGWLSKPFTEQELKTVLDRAFGKAATPPGDGTRAKDVRREIRDVLHEQKSTSAALNNYVRLLQKSELTDEQRRVVDGIETALMKLDAKTEHLRSFLLTVFEDDDVDDAEATAPTT